MKIRTLAVATAALVLTAGAAQARDQIRIVGSSTVFPFSTAVAEKFGEKTDFPTPVVESTGSGGGLKLFCGGVGEEHPDITNASRRIKESEVALCAENGVADIIEVKIGFDGIVIANSVEAAQMDIGLRELWMALAAEVPDGNGGFVANPYTNWSDIDASLPNYAIRVLGPPPTSGTRDAFVELAMEGGCKQFDEVKALKESDEDRYDEICQSIREDGAFVEAGENDNLIVNKLEADPDAFGIFGYSFLTQNDDKVQGSLISGEAPTFENIADGAYPVSRSLYFYVKTAHIGVVPGIDEYIVEFTDEGTWGPFGYLANKGLIPLPDDERAKVSTDARAHNNLSM
ncbi:MAG: substrate-binding domain-containing protein [Pseudomonadota bacterium]